jgi:hypothetical protein
LLIYPGRLARTERFPWGASIFCEPWIQCKNYQKVLTTVTYLWAIYPYHSDTSKCVGVLGSVKALRLMRSNLRIKVALHVIAGKVDHRLSNSKAHFFGTIYQPTIVYAAIAPSLMQD